MTRTVVVCLLSLILAFVFGCNREKPDPKVQVQEKHQTISKGPLKVATGNVVYVPAYAEVFYHQNQGKLSLVTTLAIHNTDPKHSLILRSIRYYSENGTLLKEYLTEPRILSPMATATYGLYPEEPNVGIGANAVIEWVSEHNIVKPIIEAVMISTQGTYGVSFISPGYAIQDIVE
jgi:hypothetical protein